MQVGKLQVLHKSNIRFQPVRLFGLTRDQPCKQKSQQAEADAQIIPADPRAACLRCLTAKKFQRAKNYI
jgi:hypothetical protein